MQANKSKNNNSYIKYSSIAMQMAIIIVGGTFGGKWLDSFIDIKFPVFTLIFSIISVFLAVYYAIKDIIKINK